MNNFFIFFFSFLFLFSLVSATDINSWSDLNNVRNDLDGVYNLRVNLSSSSANYSTFGSCFDEIGWVPLGNSSSHFTGVFNGNGFSINDLCFSGVNWHDYPLGLFGVVDGAQISNLNFYGSPEVSGLSNDTGFLAGIVENSVITNIGLSHINFDPYVSNIRGWRRGGLIGSCYYSNLSYLRVSDSNVSGRYYVGGLVGLSDGCTISRSSVVDSRVVGDANSVGGLLGDFIDYGGSGSLSLVYSSGTVVFGVDYVGGLIGRLRKDYTSPIVSPVVLSDSYSGNIISGDDSVGGVVGYFAENGDQHIYNKILNVYSYSNVFGLTDVGGVVGGDSSDNCDDSWGSVIRSYFDGSVFFDLHCGGDARTHAEMFNIAKYISWDIGPYNDYLKHSWYIVNGVDYPRLSWSHSGVRNPYLDFSVTPTILKKISSFNLCYSSGDSGFIDLNKYFKDVISFNVVIKDQYSSTFYLDQNNQRQTISVQGSDGFWYDWVINLDTQNFLSFSTDGVSSNVHDGVIYLNPESINQKVSFTVEAVGFNGSAFQSFFGTSSLDKCFVFQNTGSGGSTGSGVFSFFLDFWNSMFPEADSLTMAQKLGYVFVTMFVCSIILVFGISFAFKTMPPIFLWIILMIDVFLVGFFVSIGYFPLSLFIFILLLYIFATISRMRSG